MKTVIGLVHIVQALFSFYRQWRDWKRSVDLQKELDRKTELSKAIEESKKAETDEEVLNSQRRIVDNSN